MVLPPSPETSSLTYRPPSAATRHSATLSIIFLHLTLCTLLLRSISGLLWRTLLGVLWSMSLLLKNSLSLDNSSEPISPSKATRALYTFLFWEKSSLYSLTSRRDAKPSTTNSTSPLPSELTASTSLSRGTLLFRGAFSSINAGLPEPSILASISSLPEACSMSLSLPVSLIKPHAACSTLKYRGPSGLGQYAWLMNRAFFQYLTLMNKLFTCSSSSPLG